MEVVSLSNLFRLASAEFHVLNYADRKINKERYEKEAEEAKAKQKERAEKAAAIIKQQKDDSADFSFGKRSKYL